MRITIAPSEEPVDLIVFERKEIKQAQKIDTLDIIIILLLFLLIFYIVLTKEFQKI